MVVAIGGVGVAGEGEMKLKSLAGLVSKSPVCYGRNLNCLLEARESY